MAAPLDDEQAIGDELTTLLLATLDQTPPLERTLFLLNRVYGFPLGETCMRLEVDPAFARRVIANLADRIAPLARRDVRSVALS